MSGAPIQCPAISIRQPFAEAVVSGAKPIENRSRSIAGMFRKLIGERVLIHAAKNMHDDEWREAREFMSKCGYVPPPPDDLFYGCSVGSVEVVEVVEASVSPWFTGPAGIVFAKPRRCDEYQMRGKPGVFYLEGKFRELLGA